MMPATCRTSRLSTHVRLKITRAHWHAYADVDAVTSSAFALKAPLHRKKYRERPRRVASLIADQSRVVVVLVQLIPRDSRVAESGCWIRRRDAPAT